MSDRTPDAPRAIDDDAQLRRVREHYALWVAGCGWRGEISALRREDEHGGIAFLCPVCGHQVGHTHQAQV
jgi:hypothetical protein